MPQSNSSKVHPSPLHISPVYLPHGGGPWPFMDNSTFGPAGMYEPLEGYLRDLPNKLSHAPRAIVVISAHWEESVPTVLSHERPPMLYDYSGFPKDTYSVKWPAPGAPQVAQQIRELLNLAKIDSAEDATRGFDHGVFVPLWCSYPQANIPTTQLSLKRGLDPETHLQLGRALAPLTKEGVLLLGSGMSYHNMGGFFGREKNIVEHSDTFDAWLEETVSLPRNERDARLVAWERAPHARACHPREEHLLPLMVIAGASENAAGTVAFRDRLLGARVSAFEFPLSKTL